MSPHETLVLSRKTYMIGVYTIIITVVLALGGGVIGVTYNSGAWTKRVENAEQKIAVHDAQIRLLETAGNARQRSLDRIEYNLKAFMERSGVRYTQLP